MIRAIEREGELARPLGRIAFSAPPSAVAHSSAVTLAWTDNATQRRTRSAYGTDTRGGRSKPTAY
jgi:hypothetical protein